MADEPTTETTEQTTPPGAAVTPEPAAATEPPSWAEGVPADLVGSNEAETIANLTRSYKSAVDLAKKRRSEDGLGIGGDDNGSSPIDSIEDLLKRAEIDPDDANAAIEKNGKLSKSQQSKLTKLGFGPKMVDSFLANQRAATELQALRNERLVDIASQAAGGFEQLESLERQATQSLSQDQLDVYNRLMRGDGVTADSIRAGVQYLQSTIGNARPGAPADATSSSPAKPGVKGYENKTELRKAVNEMHRRRSQGQDVSEILAAISATPENVRKGNHR